MAKRFAGTVAFAQPSDEVFATLCDPAYVVWKHEHMAAHDVTAQARQDGAVVTITSSRKLPAEVPSAARSLVGDTVTITEVHVWQPASSGETRHGTVTASFGGAPMDVSGSLELRADGTGTVLQVVIHAKAGIPLIGGKLEQMVGEQFMRALRKEQKIAPEWFES